MPRKVFLNFFLYFLGTKPFNTVRVLALVIRTGPDLPVCPVKQGTRASTGPGHLKDRHPSEPEKTARTAGF